MTNREEIERRRTFAIISHPDAGKTTLTEKLLLYGGAINQAGSVKGKQSAKHAVSDWMDIEKQRGSSPASVAPGQTGWPEAGRPTWANREKGGCGSAGASRWLCRG